MILKKTSMRQALAYLFLVVALGACAKSHRAVDPAAAVIPERIYQPPPAPVADGAIWPGDTPGNLLFVDAKGKNVGDIVTVTIEEDATSTQSATTDTSKDSEVDMAWESFLGLPSNLGV